MLQMPQQVITSIADACIYTATIWHSLAYRNVICISVSGDCIYCISWIPCYTYPFTSHPFIILNIHTTFYYIMQQENHPDLSPTGSAALHADHVNRSDTVFVLTPAN